MISCYESSIFARIHECARELSTANFEGATSIKTRVRSYGVKKGGWFMIEAWLS